MSLVNGALRRCLVDLKEEAILGGDVGRHWYYRAKLGALARVSADCAPRQVLDVGAGSGFFSRELLRSSPVLGATCVDPGYAADSDEDVEGKPLAFRREVGSSDADLVLMMDVLEHVADDAALVAEYVDKVPSGTRFFATVPAFQWLWSGHDVFLEHHRRYTLRQLEATLARGGLRVVGGSYLYGALFPVAVAARFARKMTEGGTEPRSHMSKPHPAVNAVLSAICQAELPLFRRNRLAGLTATAWAIKP